MRTGLDQPHPVDGAAVAPAGPVRRDAARRAALAGAMAVGAGVVAAWVALIAVAHLWGTRILQPRSLVFWPPLAGRLDPRFALRALPAVALAVAGVAWGPTLARRLSWRGLLAVAALAAAAWAVTLAASDGWHALVQPLQNRFDYLSQVGRIGHSPGAFLRDFTTTGLHAGVFVTQVRGHPPGFILLLWSMAKAGLGGARAEATLLIVVAAAAVPAVLLAVRELAGESLARAAAPFLMLAPLAVTAASSADALYLGVGAWGVTLLVLATGRRGARSDLLAVAGGLVLGAGLFLSYGLVPLAAIPVVVAVARRRLRPMLVGAAAVALVAVVFWVLGFWWVEGLLATRHIYASGVSVVRPYGYFLLANLAAFAVIVGPATFAGLARLRDRRLWLLVGGALLTVILSDLSGLSKGETERIWLPFAPWVIVACAALATRRPAEGARAWIACRGWLALNVAAGLALQFVVRSPW